MKQYLDNLDYILTHGRRKVSRTGIDTLSVTGLTFRHHLKDGFPLLTSKHVGMRNVGHELLFFLQGRTNNNWLKGLNCHIWDEWELAKDHTEQTPLTMDERLTLLANKLDLTLTQTRDWMQSEYSASVVNELALTPYEFEQRVYAKYDIPSTKEHVVHEAGSLGPVYGAQWRNWLLPDGTHYDQFKVVDELLRDAPHSRRMLISGWNAAVLPDEAQPHHVNIINGKQVLSPCHTLIQFVTQPLTREEILDNVVKDYGVQSIPSITYLELTDTVQPGPEELAKMLSKVLGGPIKTMQLDLLLTQRSCDYPLGEPYNIASYSLLLALMAQRHNLVPGEFIQTAGDAHIYVNQIETAKEQLTRGTHPLPHLLLNPSKPDILTFDPYVTDISELFKVVNYKHSGKLAYPSPAV